MKSTDSALNCRGPTVFNTFFYLKTGDIKCQWIGTKKQKAPHKKQQQIKKNKKNYGLLDIYMDLEFFKCLCIGKNKQKTKQKSSPMSYYVHMNFDSLNVGELIRALSINLPVFIESNMIACFLIIKTQFNIVRL